MEHYDENGDTEYACGGDDDCPCVDDMPDCLPDLRHMWTSQGTGGCDGNPGAWALGGTAYRFDRRCRVCGLRERTTHYGYQRNPGECDTRRYKRHTYAPEPDAVQHAHALARRRESAARSRRLRAELAAGRI